MNYLLEDMEKWAVVVNPERTNSRVNHPGFGEAFGKLTVAEMRYIAKKNSYDQDQRKIRTLDSRVMKNQSRYHLAKDAKLFKDQVARYAQEAKALSQKTDKTPNQIDDMGWSKNLAKINAHEYKKRYELDPGAIKNLDHYEKYYDKSRSARYKAMEAAVSEESLQQTISERDAAAKRYREDRRAYKVRRKEEPLTKSVQETLDDLSAGAGIKPPSRNRYLKPIAIGAGVAATAAGGAYLYNRYKKKKRAQAEQEKTAASRDAKISGLMTAGGLGLTAATLYGSLAMQKRLKEKYGDIDGVNETSILSGIGNDKASNRIYATKEQRERAEKFRKSFNRLNFGSRVGFGVGGGLGVAGASMLADAVSRR